jgi:predicted Zn-ribbon and HTH transcriptional regulator
VRNILEYYKHREKIMKANYRCCSVGSVNNGLLKECGFQFRFEEGSHNCPLCGSELVRVSTGKSVAQILKEGFEKERKQNKS